MQILDMEKIAAEVKEAAGKREYPQEIPKFENSYVFDTDIYVNYDSQLFEESVRDIGSYSAISEYPAYFGRGFKAAVKRLIVKFVRFYLLPVVEQQNLFNHSVKENAMQTYSCVLLQNKQIEELQQQVKQLQAELEQCKKQ